MYIIVIIVVTTNRMWTSITCISFTRLAQWLIRYVCLFHRLLSYAASAVHGRSLQVWGCGPEFPECTDQTAVQAMTLLREGFAVGLLTGLCVEL